MKKFRVRLFPKGNIDLKPKGLSVFIAFSFMGVGTIGLIYNIVHMEVTYIVIDIACIVIGYLLYKRINMKGSKLKSGALLELKIGSPTEYDYDCVDVFHKGNLIGDIRKRGIDELIEKGAFVRAEYAGHVSDVPQITITALEHHEYVNKPEYKAWRDKLE